MTGIRLLATMRLGDAKARDHLMPLVMSGRVDHITLVRHGAVEIDSLKLSQNAHAPRLDEVTGPRRTLASLGNVVRCLYHGIRIARRDRPHAVVAFNFTPYGIVAWLIARAAGAKVIVGLIGTDYHGRLRAPILGPMLRMILRRVDGVAIFGQGARRDLIRMGLDPGRVFILPNTIDTDRFHPDPAPGSATPTFDLVCTCRLIPLKRVDALLRALQVIHETRPGTTLLVIGDGEERTALERLSCELGVEHAVTFRGWAEDVPGALRQARVLALLSEAEGLPMAMLEAMACGLPVVVTDVGAIGSVIEDGVNGHLVPPAAEPGEVAKRVLRLLNDTGHYQMVREAALRVGRTHGYDATARVWDQVLARLGG